jgi:hypothetical protein
MRFVIIFNFQLTAHFEGGENFGNKSYVTAIYFGFFVQKVQFLLS